jgi:glycosyltransferase involved in cell wall biosynthesis
VLEAACTGIPTVGTLTGYVADWHPHRAIGVPVANADALATAVIDLLHDAPRRLRLAEAARDWALAHDTAWTALELEKLYTEVVTRQLSTTP